jgi:hypothetical protein
MHRGINQKLRILFVTSSILYTEEVEEKGEIWNNDFIHDLNFLFLYLLPFPRIRVI